MEQLSSYKSQILIGIVSFGAGIGLGYLLGKRNKEPTYQVIPSANKPEELEDDIPTIATKNNSTAVKEFIQDAIDGKLGENVVFEREVDIENEVEAIAVNIFTNEDSDWNYETELAKRSPEEPYVIHRDEFYANEKDYLQSTLTYYSGDNILCDEDDTPVYNHDAIVGQMLFGHGSGDPNTFHVRNDKRKAEYEILKDPGLFSVEVLGLEIEPNDRTKGLQHSGVPKFRDD